MGQHRTVYATFWIRSHACATTRPQISTYRNRQDRNYRFRECFLITSTNLARAGNFFIGCWGSHNDNWKALYRCVSAFVEGTRNRRGMAGNQRKPTARRNVP